MSRLRIIDGTYLKLFAALLMLIDHIGLILFPNILVFRIIGRLSFPIFAFMISEGAKYTKNKVRYLLTMLLFGVFCQVVLFLATGSLLMCILITFSASTLLIFEMQYFKTCLFDSSCPKLKTAISLLIFLLSVGIMAALNYVPYFRLTLGLSFDGGFAGCLAPVFASLFVFRGTPAPENLKKLDNIPARLLSFALPLLALITISSIQWVSLFAIIPLLFYSERRGRLSLKYFFYIFYPVHLGALWLIFMLIQ